MTNHRKPLAPGEIRTHTVGQRTFSVMHVMNGGMAQAGYRDAGSHAVVITTDRFADVAVTAYADAIQQAESDAIDALDDADGPSFTAGGAFIDGGATQQDRDDAHAEALADLRYDQALADVFADDVAALRDMIADLVAAPDAGPMLAALARIVAQVPQRAVGPYDMPLWQHECGWPVQDTAGSKHCPRCGYSTEDGWQALYTLGGRA